MNVTKLFPGFYKVEINNKVYLVEDVSHKLADKSKKQWDISIQTNKNGVLYREPACDCASTLKKAKALIASWEG